MQSADARSPGTQAVQCRPKNLLGPQRRTPKRPVTTSFLGKRAWREAQIVFVCAFAPTGCGDVPSGARTAPQRRFLHPSRPPVPVAARRRPAPSAMMSRGQHSHRRWEPHAWATVLLGPRRTAAVSSPVFSATTPVKCTSLSQTSSAPSSSPASTSPSRRFSERSRAAYSARARMP